MKTFKEFMEQMTPPKAPGKRNLLNLTPTEKKLDSLVRLSNRAGVRRALQTGKAVLDVAAPAKPNLACCSAVGEA